MRICIIQDLLPFHSTGGFEFVGWHTALGLSRRGHQVTVVAVSDDNHKGEHVIDGVRVVFSEAVTPWCLNYHEVFAREAFDKYLRSHVEKFDVVQVRGWEAAALVGTSCKKKPLHIPVSGHTAGLGFAYEFETKCRTIWNDDNSWLDKLKAMLAKKKNYLIYTLPKEREVRHLDAFSTVTTRGLKLARYLYGMPIRKLHLVNDGIPVERFPFPSTIDHGSKVILYVGGLVSRKGVHLLIRAMSHVIKEQHGATLRIIGEGPELEYLQELARRLGIEKRVFFVGRLENTEIPRELQSCAVFVNPSISTVGYETVQIEAMLCERIVVAPNTPSNRMILAHEETGLFFRQGNVRSLANTIVTALCLGREARERIGTIARRNAIENFSVDKMAEMNEQVFQKMIAEFRSTSAGLL